MDFIDQLKSQVDIVRVVSDYVRLRRIGRRYSGLCPFHNEKTPSFSIYIDHQFFKCFGCDAKGDVIKFVEMIDRLTFWEAVKKLADMHGIPLPKRSQGGDEETRLRAALYVMHEVAVEHFCSNLMAANGANVRTYLEQRGVARKAWDHFSIGLSDGGGRTLLRIFEQRGFKGDQMEASGLIGKRDDGGYYDRFRNRLMFPIHSESGKVIGFGGRALDPEEKAKYMNSPETPIYRKSHVLYNLNRAKEGARERDRIVLVEGYMDVIGATQAGVAEAVAPCGTALTVDQIRSLKRHSGNLYLNFDPDAAGEKAAERSIKLLLEENVRVRVVELEGGLDPDEYCKAHGAERYLEKVVRAKSYFYWLADRARGRFNMREPQGRVDAFQFLMPAIQSLNDKIERVAVVNDLAGYLGVETGVVLEHFRKNAGERSDRQVPSQKKDPARAVDRILLPLLLTSEEARERLVPELRNLAAIRQFSTAPIYETLFNACEAGEPVSFHSIHDRLAEPHQELLSTIVLEAETAHTTEEDGVACIESLRKEEYEAVSRELRSRIKAAERAGDMKEALALMRELSELG